MRKSREFAETKIERSQCTICLTMHVVGEKSCACPVGTVGDNKIRKVREYNNKSRKRNGYK